MKTFKIAALLFVLAAGVFGCSDDIEDFKVTELPEVAAPANEGDSSGGGTTNDCPDC